MVGCIDGTFINIRTPAHKVRSTYCNRHDVTALTMQGICDADRKFIDCFTGTSGRMHDARIFRLSYVRDKVMQMGQDFHLLGDGAYPLSVNLLTPYRNCGNMPEEHRLFNIKFSSTRVKIENAFGLLKQRFRQLIRLDGWYILSMSRFILSCCVTHNICLELDDFLEEIEEFVEVGDGEPNEQLAAVDQEARQQGVL